MLGRHGALLLSVLAAAAALCASAADSGLQTRSGDITVMHARPIKGDAALIAIDSVHEDLATNHAAPAPSEMLETEVASLISHVVGALPLSASVPKQAGAFPSSTVLRKPRANLLINIPDVGLTNLEEMSMARVQNLRHEHSSFSVASTFEPRHGLAQITTLATGKVPSVHGITGSQWVNSDGSKSVAFTEMGSHAAVPTVADVVAHTFEDSLVVSLSGCAQFAAATSMHQKDGQSNSLQISVDGENKRVNMDAGFSHMSPVAVNDETISAFLASSPLLALFKQDGGVVSLENNKVVVQHFAGADKANTVEFDLSQQADFKFVAELVAVDRLVSLLKTETVAQFAADNHPDLFTLSFVGLKKLLAEYGAEDTKTLVAAQLLDAAVPQILKQFQQAYHNNLAAEIVLMGTPTVVMHASVQKEVVAAVGSSIHSEVDVDSTYPSIYVEEEIPKSEIQALCSRVSSAVSKHGLRANCISEMSRPVFLQEKSAAKATVKANAQSTSEKIINYQINLWVTVLLVLVLLGGLYPLMYLDVTGGTFSSFLYSKKYV